MKRLYFILMPLVLLVVVSSVLAQTRDDRDGDSVPDSRDQCPDTPGSSENSGCPVLQIAPLQPPSPTDSDGDGLPDSDDNCPLQPGPRENGGCPETTVDDPPPAIIVTPMTPPNNDDVPEQPPQRPNDATPVPPPFTPPALPIDGCYVTPLSSNNINVRQGPDLGEAIIGRLNPGVIYESMGYIVVGSEAWFALNTYEGFAGTIGYASRSVLNVNNDCLEIAPPATGGIPTGADDLAPNPIALCHMSVGWDAPTWSTSEPQGESVVNMALWFAYEPGVEIPAGTNALGVIYLRGGVILPDAENIFTIMTDPLVLDAALNSDNPAEYGYPTAANAVQSGDAIFYRLTTDIGEVGDENGNCGPIVADIDGFAETTSTTAQPISVPINEYACTLSTSYDFIFAFNAAPGEAIPVDNNPIAIINATYVWDGWSTPASWTTSLEQFDGETLQYMVNPFWASLVRIGGTCGPIGTARR